MATLWQVLPSRAALRCRQCGEAIAAGEPVAQHAVSGLAYHPACAGLPSHTTPVSGQERPAVPQGNRRTP